MVATKLILAIMAVMVAACIAFAPPHKSEKCKYDPERFTDEDKKYMAECYTDVTGKAFDPATCNIEELQKDDKEKFGECVGEKMGVITAEGAFDAKKAKEEVAKIDTDDKTRQAILDGIDSCNSAGGGLKKIQECMKAVMKKECGV